MLSVRTWIAPSLASLAFSQSQCPHGSLPYFNCDFNTYSSSNACWPAINWGQAAAPNGPCEIPTPQNGCALVVGENKTWMWKSAQATCCNCFQLRSYEPSGGGYGGVCPADTWTYNQCSFGPSGTCYEAVNKGQMAQPRHGECQVPTYENGCKLVPKSNGVYSWESPNVNCCNCYLRKNYEYHNGNGGGYPQQQQGSSYQNGGDYQHGGGYSQSDYSRYGLAQSSQEEKNKELRVGQGETEESSMLQVARPAVVAESVSTAQVLSSNPCPRGSVPIMNCSFSRGYSESNTCWAGVNTGQAASPYGPCAIPTPQNGCTLQPQQDLSWQWVSSSGTTCCNCFQVKRQSYGNYCQADSLPLQACNMQDRFSYNSCYPAVNTAQSAKPRSGECQVPTPSNGCKLVVNRVTEVYSWQSDMVNCCNCFLRRNFESGPYTNGNWHNSGNGYGNGYNSGNGYSQGNGYYLAQVGDTVESQDLSSMLQVPTSEL